MALLRANLKSGRRGDSISDQYYKARFEDNSWKLVESVNAFGASFFNEFLNDHEGIREDFCTSIRKGPMFGGHLLENMVSWQLKRDRDRMNMCLDLIDKTSKADYDGSGKKWSRAAKRKEILLPDMKYLLYWQSPVGEGIYSGGELIGFVSFMITYEDGHEVIYIYEIHFKESHQGLGYGRDLMNVVEAIGREVGVEKAMLTVFKSNERAVKWYHKRGYIVDEYSPEPKKFRDGTVKEAAYLILSKKLKADEGIGLCDNPDCRDHGRKVPDEEPVTAADQQPPSKKRRVKR